MKSSTRRGVEVRRREHGIRVAIDATDAARLVNEDVVVDAEVRGRSSSVQWLPATFKPARFESRPAAQAIHRHRPVSAGATHRLAGRCSDDRPPKAQTSAS